MRVYGGRGSGAGRAPMDVDNLTTQVAELTKSLQALQSGKGKGKKGGGKPHQLQQQHQQGKGSQFPGTCHNCGAYGHKSADCRKAPSGQARGRSASRGPTNGRPRSSTPSRTGTCHSCGKPGHFARECPNNKGKDGKNGKARGKGKYKHGKNGKGKRGLNELSEGESD